MNCQEAQTLLDAYVDGELDLVRTLEIDRHVPECPACAEALRKKRELGESLRDPSLYHPAPAGLRERLRLALPPSARPRPALRPRLWTGLAVAASAASVALLAWALLRSPSVPAAEDLLAQEVVSSHVRSLMAEHLVDEPSSDRHTVKPWFNGRVDFSPPVIDPPGFSLAGGRLDYLDNRKAAALVYRRRKHVINLFIWPTTDNSNQVPEVLTRQGYHLVHWVQGDLTFWAVSDLNEKELEEFVGLVKRQINKP